MPMRSLFTPNLLVLMLVLFLLGGCVSKPDLQKTVTKVDVVPLDNENFSSVALASDSVALVLITDGSGSLSALEKHYFESTFEQEVPLVLAHFDASDKTQISAYGVTRAPAVALFANGFLVDQVAGEPSSYDESVDLRRDYHLWLQTTVLEHVKKSGNKVQYRFNNTTKMSIATY